MKNELNVTRDDLFARDLSQSNEFEFLFFSYFRVDMKKHWKLLTFMIGGWCCITFFAVY